MPDPIDGYSVDPTTGQATFHAAGQPVVTLPGDHPAAQAKMAQLGQPQEIPRPVGPPTRPMSPAEQAMQRNGPNYLSGLQGTAKPPPGPGAKFAAGAGGMLSDAGASLMRAGGANVAPPKGPLERMHQAKQAEQNAKKQQEQEQEQGQQYRPGPPMAGPPMPQRPPAEIPLPGPPPPAAGPAPIPSAPMGAPPAGAIPPAPPGVPAQPIPSGRPWPPDPNDQQ